MSVPASARTAAAKASATAGESTATAAATSAESAAYTRDPANTAATEHGKENGSDDRNRHQQNDEQVSVVERMPWRGAPGRCRGQRLSAADDFDDSVDAGVDALRELALLEVRRDGFGDDPSRGHVGQHALETV